MSFSFSLTCTLSLTHSLVLIRSLSFSLSHTLILAASHSFSLVLCLTHTHVLTHTHTITHAHFLLSTTLSHSFSLRISLVVPYSLVVCLSLVVRLSLDRVSYTRSFFHSCSLSFVLPLSLVNPLNHVFSHLNPLTVSLVPLKTRVNTLQSVGLRGFGARCESQIRDGVAQCMRAKGCVAVPGARRVAPEV